MPRSVDSGATMNDPDPRSQQGYASIAVTGTAWATGQMVLNKVATIAATLVISRKLSQDQVAVASLAIMVVKFFTVLPPQNMADVLIARSRHIQRLVGPASRVALQASIAIALGIAALSPLVAGFYAQFPFALLVALLLVAALRPVGEGAQIGPMTELRLDFRNRTIAIIDGVVQLCATSASVLLAVLDAGAWAVVLPLSLAALAKAAVYNAWRSRVLGSLPSEERLPIGERREIRCQFLAAGGGQYLHAVTDVLPVMVLGKLATESATGLYAFAFNIAGQTNALIGSQISSVIQPLLGKLGHDADRQVSGYVRALRALGAVTVPLCICQAAFAPSLFALLFDERWRGSIPIFAMLSISEAFFFAAAPTMALLKAQGRFRTFVAWQGIHLALMAAALPAAAIHGGAFAVAVANTCIWAISLPCATWLATRARGVGIGAAIWIFLAPWTTALPIGVGCRMLSDGLLVYGKLGSAFGLLVGAPSALVAMLLLTRVTQPRAFGEISPFIRRILRRR